MSTSKQFFLFIIAMLMGFGISQLITQDEINEEIEVVKDDFDLSKAAAYLSANL
jgi:hypothetical protein